MNVYVRPWWLKYKLLKSSRLPDCQFCGHIYMPLIAPVHNPWTDKYAHNTQRVKKDIPKCLRVIIVKFYKPPILERLVLNSTI